MYMHCKKLNNLYVQKNKIQMFKFLQFIPVGLPAQ